MDNLEVAKRKRMAAKGWLTRIAGQLDRLLGTDNISEVELEEIILDFEDKLRAVDEAQSEVEQFIDLDGLELDLDVAANFRRERKSILFQGKSRLREMQRAVNNGIPGTETDARSELESNISGGSIGASARLPTLQLSKFSGNYTEWPTFWDKFSAVVDVSPIPAINKFSYLQSLLVGEAASAIKGLSLTVGNYETAKDILRKRFGRPERIIFGHIQELLKNQASSSKDSATSSSSSLWKLHDDIQSHVRSLENLGVDGDKYGVFLTPLVLHQLPTVIRLEWARVGEGREGDLSFLLSFLYDEIRRRERSQTFDGRSGFDSSSNNPPKGRPAAASALLAQNCSSFSSGKKQKRCVFCQEEHYSDQCAQILSLNFEQRREKIQRLKLCFLCLGPHLAKQCKRVCFYCKGSHHAVLCKPRIKVTQPATVGHDADPVHVGVSYSNSKKLSTVMQVVHAKICGTDVSIMFDSGSDRSFVTNECAKKLKLKVVKRELLQYNCFGENAIREEEKDVFELNFDATRIHLIGMKYICQPMHRSAIPQELLSDFSEIPFSEEYDKDKLIKIDILIGLDLYWSLIRSQRGDASRGLVAQETLFGWMLSGVYSRQRTRGESENQSRALFCHSYLTDPLVTKMWDLESIGICGDEVSTHAKEDQEKFLSSFSDKILYQDGRYVVKLPWKNEQAKMSIMDNRDIAERRILHLNRRLKKDLFLREKYDSVLAEYEREGIIKEVPDHLLDKTENPIFYLPHRPVLREDSLSTKVRPVFDASCKAQNGISLNDCVEIGPKLIPDLVEILLRFRKWKFGMTADIQKAFLQIKLHEEDQDVHRFLWMVDDHIRTMRFDRVCFGNACSPFLLNITIRHHLEKFCASHTLSELQKNLYVDDWITGADTDNEILNMMTQADKIMRQGGFILTKWSSSCKDEREEMVKAFEGTKDQNTTKVLGMSWNTGEDSFIFTTVPAPETCLFTKRMVLSTIARLFDPIGLLTPFSITLKIIFQDAWKNGYDWDATLPEEKQTALKKWMDDLKLIRNWKIPRCISLDSWKDSGEKELLIFSDASEKAYGCCIYLKSSGGERETVCLVMSRVKVAPLKRISLPRLELLAALLGARLLKFVESALGLETEPNYSCWTDSKIVLGWIKGDPSRWKQFVSNRVQEIQQHTNPARWKHCPGKENPADLLTRGIKADELVNSNLWLHGPLWLRKNYQESPWIDNEESDLLDSDEVVSEEMRGGATLASFETDQRSPLRNLLDYEKFSDFNKIVRIISWIMRFVRNCKQKHVSERVYNKDLSSEELELGKNSLLQAIQRHYYCEELKDLEENRNVKRSSSIYKLSPCIGQHGFLRVKGRLDFAPSLLYDDKHPIILPKCHVSYLIVKAQHSLLKHAGVNTLISTLRNTYWIVSIRTLAKNICKKCIDCQRQDSRPCEQITAPLPEDRIKKTPPFSVIGIDHAGPLFCSDLPDKKLYILLFTCAIVRAVHIELVDSLSLEDFILAFRRFSARKGRPSVVYSDNARTFKGACSLLQREMGHHTLIWKFSAPLSPWWGGWWERLIRSIKSSLRKSLGQKVLCRIELETDLHEIEACINSRPLTYVEATGVPLSPSHFLIGRSSPMNSNPVGEFCEEIGDLGLRQEYQSILLKTFWECWRNDYLRNLPPMRVKKQNSQLTTGTVVLIREDGKPRLKWPLGIVTKTFPGKDGFVRAVELKTNKGLIVRAVQKLHRLEMCENRDNPVSPSESDSDAKFRAPHVSSDNDQEAYTTRSGRKVKKTAKIR